MENFTKEHKWKIDTIYSRNKELMDSVENLKRECTNWFQRILVLEKNSGNKDNNELLEHIKEHHGIINKEINELNNRIQNIKTEFGVLMENMKIVENTLENMTIKWNKPSKPFWKIW